jgi:hypothetical protein
MNLGDCDSLQGPMGTSVKTIITKSAWLRQWSNTLRITRFWGLVITSGNASLSFLRLSLVLQNSYCQSVAENSLFCRTQSLDWQQLHQPEHSRCLPSFAPQDWSRYSFRNVVLSLEYETMYIFKNTRNIIIKIQILKNSEYWTRIQETSRTITFRWDIPVVLYRIINTVEAAYYYHFGTRAFW